ncbi:MAG: peptidyl-prolyl cis-trans isomerase [Sandarakinorhabdus sp.]|nr:peptidyl-prolyl cis-trans isomerase [Sandarakinorhabdus sp.]
MLNFRQVLREPMVHFLALGLGLFLLHALVVPVDHGDGRVTVSKGQIADIAAQYQTSWGRPPTPAELQALVEAEVKSRILYREGKAMGLDRDDSVIERRVRQKYELMTEEENAGPPPSEVDLAAYLAAHPAQFRRPPAVAFDQLLFTLKGGDAAIEARVTAARKALAAGASPARMGDWTMLPRHVDLSDLDLVARDFGERFAGAAARAPIGEWGPPVLSGNGVHLLRVTERTAATLPTLDEVRGEVAREWENDRRTKASDASYARLRARYKVAIEAYP